VKIKRILSVSLILLVLASSTGDGEVFSRDDHPSRKLLDQTNSKAQFIKDSQEASQEFRESHKISVSEEGKSGINMVIHKTTLSMLQVSAYIQYSCYWREYLSRSVSKKLFITFGALLI
jgi:hypothetical protein